jgi:hypothetical protein
MRVTSLSSLIDCLRFSDDVPSSIHPFHRRGTMVCAVTDRSSFRRVVLRIVMILSLCHPVACFQYTLTSVLRRTQPRHAKIVPYSFASACRPLSSSSSSSQETESSETASASAKAESPWTGPELQERMKARKSNARYVCSSVRKLQELLLPRRFALTLDLFRSAR